jgi:hypothetical protein
MLYNAGETIRAPRLSRLVRTRNAEITGAGIGLGDYLLALRTPKSALWPRQWRAEAGMRI